MKIRKMNLQQFAAGDNNELPARSYQKEFKQLLQAVFAKQSYFADFFGGSIEALDGIQENETAFYVKTSDIPVVVGTAYNKDAAVAMGVGTGNTNRFGNRTEVIYTDTPVNYSWEWVFHEGIDRHTVNNDFDAAVADRLELQARAKTAKFNAKHSLFISGAAGKTIPGGTAVTKDNVADIFALLDTYYTDAEVVGTRLAKVNSVVWNAIIDSGLATSSKGSTVNIDTNTISDFKGFTIQKVPSGMFQANEVIYAYVAGVGKAFTGIETARTIESEDFDGVALQGAGKAGEYILPDNKAAVAKVTVTGA
jgi:hypothetical protein